MSADSVATASLAELHGRLKLIANNSRFLILPDWHRRSGHVVRHEGLQGHGWLGQRSRR